ncbi:hypothetical protein [Chromobacterium sp. CV08]|uniref:hypothetical protein n=1 Tax=Chromobacterium sp. CV08 TaxID=3133274 RepID=UPI003DAA0591
MANKYCFVEKLLSSLIESDDYKKSVDFMGKCLEVVYDDMPSVGQQAFSTYQEYLNGTVSSEELTNERVKCWNYLDEKDIAYDAKNKENNLLRAIMGVLHASRPSDELSECLEWFIEFLIRAGVDLELIDNVAEKFIKKNSADGKCL